MKRTIFLLIVFCMGSSLLFSQEEGNPGTGTLSISVSPLSLVSFAVLGIEGDTNPNQAFWGSFTFNINDGKKEYDLGCTKYPNYLSLYAEDRYFNNENCTGFFYAPFISADFISLSIQSDLTPVFSTEPYTYGDGTFLVGIRIGGDIGYRFSFDGWGITPKLGLAIPVFYLFDLGRYKDSDLLKIYENTALIHALDIGFKIDLMDIRSR